MDGMWSAEWNPEMKTNLAYTPASRPIGLSRKRRGGAYLRRTAQLRASALCVLLGASLLAAGNPEQFWGIVSVVLPGMRADTSTLPAARYARMVAGSCRTRDGIALQRHGPVPCG